ncbi:MAG: hypothetical protein QOH88_3479 [Verrucomicrobiota bacterium]|jgi:hypothetical protein
MNKSRIAIAVTVCIVSAALSPSFAEEPKPTRPPPLAPSSNRQPPMPRNRPAPSPAATPKETSTTTSKAKWEYMAVEEGSKFLSDGQFNPALKAKMNLFGVNGWELVAVHNEGGNTIFIYKRQL